MSEIRRDNLCDRWVIFAPRRFEGRNIDEEQHACPFCPGNEEISEEIFRITKNGDRLFKSAKKDHDWVIRVIPNKYPILRIEDDLKKEGVGINDKMKGLGMHEIIIERQSHFEIWDEDQERISLLFETIILRMKDLASDKRFRYLLAFKNYGSGGNNGVFVSHPHSQLIGFTFIPKEVGVELDNCMKYYFLKERCLVCDIIIQEENESKSLVLSNENFLAFCPYASRLPFEMMIAPRHNYHSHDFTEITSDLLKNLASLVSKCIKALYITNGGGFSMIIHTSPLFNSSSKNGYGITIGEDFHWHIHILPMLSSLAGLEIGAGTYVNQVLPEEAAKLLRENIKGGI